MDVLSVSPFQVASLSWQPSEGREALTVVAKGTFELTQGQARLAEAQDVPNEQDGHWNDDASLSIYSPSDMAPFKRQADVVLVGEAFAPGGKPVRSLVARLTVGTIDKAIEVVCDRHFDAQGQLVEGQPFVRMPLRYERAAGGPHGSNPSGIDRDGERDRYGRLQVPNLVRPGTTIGGPGDAIEPVGFGPIAAHWPTRRALLGARAATWSERSWQTSPLPADIDFNYFSVAPIDQRLDELHDTERIVLENLHPFEPRLVCHLPGVRPRAFVERHGAIRDVPMRADTLWIDTSRRICTVTWRGRINLERRDEPGRIYVAMEKPGVQLTWATVKQLAAVMHPDIVDEGTAEGIEDEHTAIGVVRPQAGALPFMHTSSQASAPPPPPPRSSAGSPRSRGHTGALQMMDPGDRSPSWLRGSSAPAPRARKAEPTSALPVIPERPPAAAEPSPAAPMSPWAQPSPPPTSGVPKTEPGAPEPPTRSSSPPRPSGAPAPLVLPPAPPAPAASPGIRPPNPVEALRERPSAPAAMDPSPQDVVGRARVAHEIVELLWYDPDCVERVRGQRQWADLLDELARSHSEGHDPLDFDAEPPPEAPPEARARRDVTTILARAAVMSGVGMEQAMLDAVDPGGRFEAPLVMMGGVLHFPFDQLETLKATLAAVTPLIAGNQELQATVDTVKELMQTPWLEGAGAGEVAEGLTEKIRNAFKRADRIVDPGYLEDHTDRILLERRCYQKRTLFGGEHIRALLAPVSGSKVRVPTYLPAPLVTELPMFKKLPVRVLADAHAQQDQYESHPTCLKVVALARAVNFSRSSQLY